MDNLNLKYLPTYGSEIRKNSDAVLLSHPGWARLAFTQQQYIDQIGYFRDSFFEGMGTTDESLPEAVSFDWMKLFYVFCAPEYLYHELKVEALVEVAKKNNFPIIITVPVKDEDEFTLISDPTQTWENYMNYLFSDYDQAFWVPTSSERGYLYGSGETVEDVAETFDTLGDKYLNPFFEASPNKLYVGGGHLNACLNQSSYYFASKMPLVFVDNAINASGDYGDFPEKFASADSDLTRLMISETRSTGVLSLLERLKGGETQDLRKPMYSKLHSELMGVCEEGGGSLDFSVVNVDFS